MPDPVRREVAAGFAVELAWSREDHPVVLLEVPARRYAVEPADAARLGSAVSELLDVAAYHAAW